MKLRFVAFVVAALVVATAAPATAHDPWDSYDTCYIPGHEYFYLGGPSQYWHLDKDNPNATGHCHAYTANTQSYTVNYADWRLPWMSCRGQPPPAGGHNDGRCLMEKRWSGTYHGLLYLIRDAHFTTRKASYLRYAFNLSRGVTSTHIIDQGAAPTGLKVLFKGWIDTRIDDGNSGFMRLVDNTGEASGSKYLGVDRLYFHPIEP